MVDYITPMISYAANVICGVSTTVANTDDLYDVEYYAYENVRMCEYCLTEALETDRRCDYCGAPLSVRRVLKPIEKTSSVSGTPYKIRDEWVGQRSWSKQIKYQYG